MVKWIFLPTTNTSSYPPNKFPVRHLQRTHYDPGVGSENHEGRFTFAVAAAPPQSCFTFMDFEPTLPGRHAKGIYEDSSMQHPTWEIWADYGCRVLASWFLHSFVAKSILAAVLDSGKNSDDSGETSQR